MRVQGLKSSALDRENNTNVKCISAIEMARDTLPRTVFTNNKLLFKLHRHRTDLGIHTNDMIQAADICVDVQVILSECVGQDLPDNGHLRPIVFAEYLER